MASRAIPRGVRAVYVTPSHQYPLGVTMSLPRRRELLDWAERNNAAIIEDDYDSEFRFADRPLEPLQTLDTRGRVVYVGSFSKTLLPTLRLGFVVLPRSLQAAMHKAAYVSHWHPPALAQAALAHLIDDGDFARHIRRVGGIYRQRHATLIGILERSLAEQLELIPSTTGLHVAALARIDLVKQIEAVVSRAADADVAVQSRRWRLIEALGYGAIATEHIPEGLRRLIFRPTVMPPARQSRAFKWPFLIPTRGRSLAKPDPGIIDDNYVSREPATAGTDGDKRAATLQRRP